MTLAGLLAEARWTRCDVLEVLKDGGRYEDSDLVRDQRDEAARLAARGCTRVPTMRY